MAERLAKKKAKADQDAATFKAFPGGVTKPFDQNGGASSPSWLSQLGGMTKNLLLTAPATILDAIPYVANIPGVKGEGAWGYEPEDIGTSNFFQAGGQALEQSTRHLVGDVTAIPGLGEDSPSYTADQIRKYGVAEGLASAGLDYGNLALTVAPFVKPTGWAIGNAINDAKYAAYLRRTKSPFPDVPTPKPGSFIDVDALQGSRLPARVVDSPATPATRLADAQTARASTPPTVAPVVETVKLPWSRQLPNSRVVKYTEPHLDEYGNLLKNGRNITLKVLDKNTKNMTGAMNIDIDFATQTATLEMMGVVDEFAVPQLAAAALHELKQFDFLKSQYPLIPSPNIPRPLIEQLQQAGLIDPSYQIPTPGPQNAFDAVQGPNFVNEWQFHEELVPQNYQSYFDSIMESLSPTKVLEPNFVISSPDAAHYFITNGGSLEQLEKVAPEYLWEAIRNNGFKGGRFDLIGSAGGHIGMDRYVDLATGKHFGLKYRPQYRFLFKNPTRQSNGFYTSTLDGPMGEILSNEVAVALGFPNMNLRLIVNGDRTVSIITDLAQDVYGGKIIDSHEAAVPANGNLPQSLAPGNFVPIEDRIRMAVLDLLIDNGDRNTSNVLFSIDEAGGIRLVPIDHEITFFAARDSGIGYGAAMNFSVRKAYSADPIKLFEEIKTIITKIQDDLQTSQIVKKFESKLLETTKKVGIDFTDLNAVDKWDFDNQIQSFENKVKAFLSTDPEELAQKYIDQIKEYVNP
jgi:hypothetical protein